MPTDFIAPMKAISTADERPCHLAKTPKRSGALNRLDLVSWVDALDELPTGAIDESDVLDWLRGPLTAFFPFDRVWCSYGDLSAGRIRVRSILSAGYGSDFLSSVESSFTLESRGCFAWWVANRRAFFLDEAGGFDETDNPVPASSRELDEIAHFSLGAIAAHGVIDPFVNAGTYISFSGVPNSGRRRTLAALNLIAPVVHSLFLAAHRTAKPSIDLGSLTVRQLTLVELARQGLSDKVIASRLSISENTVGNHLRAIYSRLGVSRRTELIAALR